jgi:hypothetical protein
LDQSVNIYAFCFYKKKHFSNRIQNCNSQKLDLLQKQREYRYEHICSASSCADYFADYFKIVNVELSMEEQVKLAKSYIGKTVSSVKDGVITHKVEKVNVVLSIKEAMKLKICSILVQDEIQNKGYAVVVSDDILAYPVELVKLTAKSKEVVLNESYTAKVYSDKIEVGCQTFPISILDELIEARNSL